MEIAVFVLYKLSCVIVYISKILEFAKRKKKKKEKKRFTCLSTVVIVTAYCTGHGVVAWKSVLTKVLGS